MNSQTKKYLRVIDQIRIDSPCPCPPDPEGKVASSYCALCDKQVHSLSQLTKKEAAQLFAKTEGKLCITMARNRNGSIRFKEQPRDRRMMWIAGFLLSFFSFPQNKEALAQGFSYSDTEYPDQRASSFADAIEPDSPFLTQEILNSFDSVDTAEAQSAGAYASGSPGVFCTDYECEYASYSLTVKRKFKEMIGLMTLTVSLILGGLVWWIRKRRRDKSEEPDETPPSLIRP